MVSGVQVSLRKVYRKLKDVESELKEISYSLLSSEKVSRKELRELERTSKEMDKGKYISSQRAISALGK